MFKLKSKLIIAVMVIFGITAFMSCEKTEYIGKKPTNQTTQHNDDYYFDKQLSLEEFAESVETEEEKNFFTNSKIIDNTKIAEKALKSLKTINEVRKPHIRFRWGKGCKRPIGICIIIPIGKLDANATAMIIDNKYVIIPNNEDNGITTDGYLPIIDDIYIDENTTIKAGIYLANYDTIQNKYNSIALDIK
jgi:hypothetical protein